MSPGPIRIVYQLVQHRCMVRIDCRRCEHGVTISAVILEKMVGRLENVANAERRLKCSRCSCKGAKVEVIFPRGR